MAVECGAIALALGSVEIFEYLLTKHTHTTVFMWSAFWHKNAAMFEAIIPYLTAEQLKDVMSRASDERKAALAQRLELLSLG
jgi:hypothetical protein